MARVTVEDCIDKVESPYELVLVAKERATQLNSGIEPTLDRDNDKNTVISLREIAKEKIKVSDLTESAVYKLRKHVEQVDDTWIFSGVFLALLDGKIGVPLFEISPLYIFSKSSPISSSSSVPSSTCSTCFLSL